MRHLAKLLVASVVICAFAASAEEVTVTKELQAAMQDIAIHSQVVTVDGSGVTPDNFQQDSDPVTLQIVMLAKPSDGAAQVSSDGEVIFFTEEHFGQRAAVTVCNSLLPQGQGPRSRSTTC